MLLKDCELFKAKGAIKMYKNIHYYDSKKDVFEHFQQVLSKVLLETKISRKDLMRNQLEL